MKIPIKNIKGYFNLNRIGFSHQLSLTFTIGIVSFAVISSILTLLSLNNNLQENMITQGRQITDSFASQSQLALLYGSPENAKDALSITRKFPDVKYIAIREKDGRPLVSVCVPPIWVAQWRYHGGEVSLSHETEDSWYFTAPVYSHSDDSNDDSLGAVPVKKELIGYEEFISAQLFSVLSGEGIVEVQEKLDEWLQRKTEII